MPTVRTYQQQVDLNPAPTPQRPNLPTPQIQAPPPKISPGPESLGAGFGQGLANIGQAMYANELARQDSVRLTQAERKLSDWELDRIYHPEHGALNVQGEDVYGLPDKLGEDYDKTASAMAGELNERQRAQFGPLVAARRSSMLQRVDSHVAQQSRVLDTAETKAAVQNETSITIANANDPARVSVGIQNVTRQLGLFGQRNGWGPEQTKAAVEAGTSDIHVGVISRLLDNGQDIQAKVYYEHAQDQILGDRRGSIEKALEVGTTAGDASRAAQDIWSKDGPKNDRDTVNLDVLANAAREMFKDDSKRANATIAELKERKVEFDASAAARSSKLESDVWQMALAGMPLGEIQKTAQYRALDGKAQTQVNEHVSDRMYELDQRAKSAADYLRAQADRARALREHVVDEAYQAETRTYERKRRAKQDADEKAYSVYEDLASDPQALSKMSEADIVKRLPDLGKTNMTGLLALRNQLNSPDKVLAATIDADMFNTVAEEAGLAPYKTGKSDTEKAQLGALRKYVEDLIDREQKDKKRPLTREEKQKLIDGAVLELPAFKGGSGWSIFPGGAPFFDQTLKKRAFEITTADIPPAAKKEIDNVLKSQGIANTEDAVIRYYVDQIQRFRK